MDINIIIMIITTIVGGQKHFFVVPTDAQQANVPP
jgi:hypothetical protein